MTHGIVERAGVKGTYGYGYVCLRARMNVYGHVCTYTDTFVRQRTRIGP